MKRNITLLILGLGILSLNSCSDEALFNAATAAAGAAVLGGDSSDIANSAVRAAVRTDAEQY